MSVMLMYLPTLEMTMLVTMRVMLLSSVGHSVSAECGPNLQALCTIFISKHDILEWASRYTILGKVSSKLYGKLYNCFGVWYSRWLTRASIAALIQMEKSQHFVWRTDQP